MKKELWIALIGVLSFLPFSWAFGQAGDLGVKDTVRLDCTESHMTPIVEGDSIAVPIYVFADEHIAGFSLAMRWTTNNVVFSSWKINTAVIPAGLVLVNTTQLHNNMVMPGWIDFTGFQNIPPSSQARLFGTMYFKVQPGAVTSTIDIDTVREQTVGGWSFELTGGTPPLAAKIKPEYVDCGQRDIRLPVYEYDSPNLPQSFSISQNTPNPFNPSTAIDFEVPRTSHVKIEVFNTLGQRVSVLVNEVLSPGFKRVTWDGTDQSGQPVSSGVYLYKMTADGFASTKKMLLVK